MNQQNNQKHSDHSKVPKERLNNYARFSGIALQMFAIIGIGTYAGVKLDEKFPNKHNLYTVVFSLVSVIMSVVYVIRRIIAISKESEK